MVHQPTIHTAIATLETLGGVLQRRTFPYVVCHADLHPANLLRDHAGHVFVIDWDEVMLAPKERDFIFVREPQADAFFRGYGQAEIDWMALTYYCWERVVQDLIVCAQDVFFRDDLGERAKADAFQLFHEFFAKDQSNIDAANAAAAHLPPDLTIPTRKNA
jgi:spectinomycin phosphotransferase